MNVIYWSKYDMPDIFHKNDSSSVSSAWMIFLLCKLEYTEVHNLGKR